MIIFANQLAGMVKLVDTPDLGSGAARYGGSSPSTRTTSLFFFNKKFYGTDFKRAVSPTS